MLAPALALALLGSAGCRREDSGTADQMTPPTLPRAVEQAQRQAETAFERAREAQKVAREQTGEVRDADRAVADRREDLSEAEQTAARERMEAQTAQIQAQAQGEVAQQQAQSAQTRAAQAQQAQDAARDARPTAPAGVDTPATASTTDPAGAAGTTATADTWGADTTAIGTVETASASQVVIRREAGKMMTLDVEPGTTTVIQNGQPATVGALTAGTKVKVSFRLERDQQTPTALRIEASGSRDEG